MFESFSLNVLAKINGMFFRGFILIGLERMEAHMWWRGLFLEGVLALNLVLILINLFLSCWNLGDCLY